jgi:hypothetical protein
MQAEELPDSQSPAEETSEVLGLAAGQLRRTGKDRPPNAARDRFALAAGRSASGRSASARTSIRSRCGELLSRNGCGAALRC